MYRKIIFKLFHFQDFLFLEKGCKRSWTFEKIKGATLVGNDTKTLPNNVSLTECQQYCLNETDFQCKSAKFKIKFDYTADQNNDTVGLCILSNTDRHLMPTAYRVSTSDDYYLENQCSELTEDSSDIGW